MKCARGTDAGTVAGNPRMGGQVRFSEDDARDAVVETVEAANRTGRMRGVLDAVRSHRVEDDFSSHWSYAGGNLRAQAAREAAQGDGAVR